MTTYLIVIASWPDESPSQQLAKAFLEQRLAACISITSNMQSYYIWKENLQETVKVLTTIISTQYEPYSTLAAMAQSFHPYSVPEIIATDISNGLNQYLAWIDKSTQQ